MPNQLTSHPVLMTGASGFLGWNLLQAAPQNVELLLQFNEHLPQPKCNSPLAKNLKLDLSSPQAISTIQNLDLSAIIYSAAYSDISTCLKFPEASKTVNLDLPAQLSSWCREQNIPFIYYSTDLIFDGVHGQYKDDSPASPLSLYGEQKAMAEQLVLENNPNALVLRCPLMYGEANPKRPAALQSLLASLKSGQTLNLFTDEYRSPVRAHRVAQFSWEIIGKLNGILNVGGQENLSRFEMGIKLAEVYQIVNPPIQALRQSDLPQLGPRPANCTLNSEKARALGFKSFTFQEELQLIKEMSL